MTTGSGTSVAVFLIMPQRQNLSACNIKGELKRYITNAILMLIFLYIQGGNQEHMVKSFLKQ